MGSNTYLLRTQMWAPVSLREAFDAVVLPGNRERLALPSLSFHVERPIEQLAPGIVFRCTAQWQGLPLQWRVRITDYEPPFLFRDEMTGAPFLFWHHRHTLHPTEEGALITDEVDYALRWGLAGRLMHRVALERVIKDAFRYRQMTLNEMFCGGRARWTDPAVIVQPLQTQP
ncbi:MAG: SRPBCC family protein [Candidatus Solibacter usitatus]|nr:SRPBCC family protein [Candidatus Solibacter usitatus]